MHRLLVIGLLAPFWCLAQPKFVPPSGMYTDSVKFQMVPKSGGTIHYTLDGHRPTPQDPVYSQPLIFKGQFSGTAQYAYIPSNPGIDYPQGSFDTTRAQNRGWLPPYGSVKRIHVVRALEFIDQQAVGEEAFATYLVDDAGSNRYELPVISLIVEPDYFFGDPEGIYVFGDHPDANYNQTGRKWERQCHLQEFNTTGKIIWEQDLGARIHGGGGRHSAQKGFRMYARESYGEKVVDHDLIPGLPYDQFKRFLLRGGGHRPDCFPKDDLSHAIMEGAGIDIQKGKSVVLFINGEYWGVHGIKERQDEFYVKYKYLMDDDQVQVLDKEGDVLHGAQRDSTLFSDIEDFAENSDLTDEDVAYIESKVDLENFMTYQASEIFFGNGDWPNSNSKMWRKQLRENDPFAPYGHDGRIRWFMYDLDGAYGGTCNGVHVTMNGLEQALSTESGMSSYTILLRELLRNESFHDRFINRNCDLINGRYASERTMAIADSLFDHLTPSMLEHVRRWRYPSIDSTLLGRSLELPSLARWEVIEDGLIGFLQQRPSYVRLHLRNYFGLVDSAIVRVDVDSLPKGQIVINDYLEPAGYPWQGTYFSEVALTIEAVANIGYQFSHWSDNDTADSRRTIWPGADSMLTAFFIKDTTVQEQLPLFINEFMAYNDAGAWDSKFEHEDWIEIYNPNDLAVDISGYFLTDSMGDFKHQLPLGLGYQIAPKGFRIFWADNECSEGLDHLDFGLNSLGEGVYLYNSDSVLVDSITFGQQTVDVSLGRAEDGAEQWISFTEPTPGFSNLHTGIVGQRAMQPFAYPSPTSETLYLSAPRNLVVFSIDGRPIRQFHQVNQLDVSNWPAGMYTLVADQREYQRIIVAR